MGKENSPNYSSIGNIKEFWLNNIAPSYFDFETNQNNYQAGIFGYINEIMSNTAEDGFNAINIARREFYPVTAKYMSSLYKMATLQSIDIPLTIPAHCKCGLIIPQDEIIENSTQNNGIYECTIDSCLKIYADNIPFMLDYPIKIISKKTDEWAHTIHYDIDVENSLSSNNSVRYLSNKILCENGTNYVIIFVDVIRQLDMEQFSEVLVRDTVLQTTTMDIDFDGDLANFEVFYKESASAPEVQLKKVLINAATPSTPFVFYEMVHSNKIRLTFKYNSTFVPKYNSEITIKVYTSLGESGNFSSFDGDLICTSESEKYPYNANMTILGKVNGSSYGGQNISSIEELRQNIVRAYSTNSTITNSNDLQMKFNETSDAIEGVNILFKKKRDDVFIRLFGAYTIVKDESGAIIPTNTLKIDFEKSLITDISADKNRVTIKPGTIFKYISDDSFSGTIATDDDGNVLNIMDIDANNTDFLFTNPFLIGINFNPNIIGYYMNTVNTIYSIDYTYVNDSSATQFITNNLIIKRNAILGHNYYILELKIGPAATLDYNLNIDLPDETADDYTIRAKYNGRIKSKEYVTEDGIGFVKAMIEYDIDDESLKYDYIQASSTLCINDNESIPGYTLNYEVGETFVANDIIGTKMLKDKNNLKVIADINYQLQENGLYIPFVIEDYDANTDGYICRAYLCTDDEIDSEGRVILTHGIFDSTGEGKNFIPVPMKDLTIECNVLFNNDGQNLEHKYNSFKGLNEYTLTNAYINSSNNLAYFIEDLKFIRSEILYSPGTTEENYIVKIDEVPVVQATWALKASGLNYFIDKYKRIDNAMQDVYYDLENNFSIDTKFFNTYGKARFHTVGNSSEDMQPLDNVKLSMSFGVSLTTNFETELFTSQFRTFVKEYIENTTYLGTASQDIYIMNLISDLKANFSEIAYIEYFGVNKYNHMAQKIIGPGINDYIEDYIPEFVNINTVYTADGVAYPDITVKITQ